jgi:hypothetical protein
VDLFIHFNGCESFWGETRDFPTACSGGVSGNAHNNALADLNSWFWLKVCGDLRLGAIRSEFSFGSEHVIPLVIPNRCQKGNATPHEEKNNYVAPFSGRVFKGETH